MSLQVSDAGPVRTLTFDDPATRNAITAEMVEGVTCEALHQALKFLRGTPAQYPPVFR